jgi:MFS family permease
MGATSLIFLKRIPDVPAPAAGSQSNVPVPWGAIAKHPPFRQLLYLNFAWAMAYGGLVPFTISWLKSDAGLTEKNVLLVSSVAFLGGLSSLWLIGSRVDRVGSKPVMIFSMFTWIAITATWFSLAAKVFAPPLWLVLVLQVFMGLGLSLVNMSNVRLAMGVIPVMGRNHFFAMFSVVQNLTLGLSPVIWGIVIDALHSTEFVWHGIVFNRYSLYFISVTLTFTATLIMTKRLQEPGAISFEELLKELLVESPQRIWVRLRPW